MIESDSLDLLVEWINLPPEASSRSLRRETSSRLPYSVLRRILSGGRSGLHINKQANKTHRSTPTRSDLSITLESFT